jgi:hypothetical protein
MEQGWENNRGMGNEWGADRERGVDRGGQGVQ